MKISTTRFGELEVPPGEVLEFPGGLPGFESRRFVLVATQENAVVAWLQSLEEPHVALLTIDPTQLVDNYHAEPKTAEIDVIKPAAGDDVAVRVIVRDAEATDRYYLNLFAPLFLNLSRRLGVQLPLVGSGYSLREPWPPTPSSNIGSSPPAQTPASQDSETEDQR